MELLAALIGILTTASLASANDLRSVLEKVVSTPEFREMEPSTRANLVTARIREAYQGDEARLVREALTYKADDKLGGEHIFKFFWTGLNIGRQSRVTLIGQLIAAEKPAVRERAWQLLELADRKSMPGEPERFEVDLSGHHGFVSDIESMPQEYLLYLFKQDGMQAWKLLGGNDGDTPVLGKLAGIIGRIEKGRTWKDEIRPQLRDGAALTSRRDAAYVAWFLGMIYGSGESARRNNPEIAAAIERSIPGLGAELMDGIMGSISEVNQTPADTAAEWIASMRDPGKDKDLQKR